MSLGCGLRKSGVEEVRFLCVSRYKLNLMSQELRQLFYRQIRVVRPGPGGGGEPQAAAKILCTVLRFYG